MSLKRSEILELWEDRHGALSNRWRSIFLRNPRVRFLTRLEPGAVRHAVNQHNKLDVIVEIATEARNSSFKTGVRSAKPREGDDKSRYAFGHYPHQPSDTDLHKRIGPTQKYSDDL